jgi:hypothetical protein
VSGLKVRSSFFESESPCSIQMLSRIMLARVARLTRSLSH